MSNDRIEQLRSEFARGRLSRRSFVEGAAALGFAAAISNFAGAWPARASTPSKGGHVKAGVADGSSSDSLDPALAVNYYVTYLRYATHNYAAELSADGELLPELAESWEASDDAKTWTFRIRKGIEFHNGKSLDVHDFVASINHHRGEDSQSGAKSLLSQVSDIRIDGPDLMIVELSNGNVDFPYILADYHLGIYPSSEGKIDWEQGVGTGGYVLERFTPGEIAEFTRNPNYWRSDRAHFDSGELLYIADVVARSNALLTGSINVMDRCDVKTLDLLKRASNIKVEETSGRAHYSMPMRTDTPPFDNVDVRLALKYALDRENLLSMMGGHGVIGNDHPISPAYRYCATAEEIPQRSYDPDQARFHLKRAGLENLVVELQASDSAFTGAVDAAVLYKETAAKAGVTIDVVRAPNDGYWNSVWMQKPWCMSSWSGLPTEDMMFSAGYAADAAWNESFWKSDRFNKLLVDARVEFDDAKRREMYVEMQRIVSDQGGAVIPMFVNEVFATSNNIQHDQMAGNQPLDGGRFFERWWYA